MSNSTTLVAPTSVSNHGGYGLYALKPFKVNTIIPNPYPGKRVHMDEFADLNDYMIAATQDQSWTVKKRNQTLEKLANDFGIVIHRRRLHDDGSSSSNLSSNIPNWDAIYDNMIAYVFQVDENYIQYITDYDWDTGNVALSIEDPKNATVFVNEPPPYKQFVNLVTGKLQDSRPNVRAVDQKGKKVFKAIRKIEPGDEFLLCYGPFYKRSLENSDEEYKINLDTKVGCGSEPLYYENLGEEDAKLLKSYLKRVETYQPEGDIFKSDTLLQTPSPSMDNSIDVSNASSTVSVEELPEFPPAVDMEDLGRLEMMDISHDNVDDDDDAVAIDSDLLDSDIELEELEMDIQDCDRRVDEEPAKLDVLTFPVPVITKLNFDGKIIDWIDKNFGNNVEKKNMARCMLTRWVFLLAPPIKKEPGHKHVKEETGVLLWDPTLRYTKSLCKSGNNVNALVKLILADLKSNIAADSVVLATQNMKVLYGAGTPIIFPQKTLVNLANEAFKGKTIWQLQQVEKLKFEHDANLWKLQDSKILEQCANVIFAKNEAKMAKICAKDIFSQDTEVRKEARKQAWRFTDAEFYKRTKDLVDNIFTNPIKMKAYLKNQSDWHLVFQECWNQTKRGQLKQPRKAEMRLDERPKRDNQNDRNNRNRQNANTERETRKRTTRTDDSDNSDFMDFVIELSEFDNKRARDDE